MEREEREVSADATGELLASWSEVSEAFVASARSLKRLSKAVSDDLDVFDDIHEIPDDDAPAAWGTW